MFKIDSRRSFNNVEVKDEERVCFAVKVKQTCTVESGFGGGGPDYVGVNGALGAAAAFVVVLPLSNGGRPHGPVPTGPPRPPRDYRAGGGRGGVDGGPGRGVGGPAGGVPRDARPHSLLPAAARDPKPPAATTVLVTQTHAPAAAGPCWKRAPGGGRVRCPPRLCRGRVELAQSPFAAHGGPQLWTLTGSHGRPGHLLANCHLPEERVLMKMLVPVQTIRREG